MRRLWLSPTPSRKWARSGICFSHISLILLFFFSFSLSFSLILSYSLVLSLIFTRCSVIIHRLEEPFKRDYDITGATPETVARHARLRAEAPLPITGAEHQPLAVYHDYLAGTHFPTFILHFQHFIVCCSLIVCQLLAIKNC